MIKKNKKSKITIDKLATIVAKGFENTATKDDLMNLKLELKTDIHDLRVEVRSFKKDTGQDAKELKNDAIDLNDTVMHHDKRIEKLENKVFV